MSKIDSMLVATSPRGSSELRVVSAGQLFCERVYVSRRSYSIKIDIGKSFDKSIKID